MRHSANQFQPSTEEEQTLLSYGIVRIPLDTPFLCEPVNVYLVLGKPLALIDGGLRHIENLARIESVFHKHGHTLEDLGEIWLTHAHLDHFGLATTLARKSNAKIYAWEKSRHCFEHYPSVRELERNAFAHQIQKAGAPPALVQKVRNSTSRFEEVADTTKIDVTFEAEQPVLIAGRLTCKALHLPGHCPWSMGFWNAENGILFGADTVLKRVRFHSVLYPIDLTPIERQGFMAYQNSLEKLLQHDIKQLLPGHGASFTDGNRYAKQMYRQQQRRQKQVTEWMQEQPIHGYDLAVSWFGPELTQQNPLLTLSESILHLMWWETSNSKGKVTSS